MEKDTKQTKDALIDKAIETLERETKLFKNTTKNLQSERENLKKKIENTVLKTVIKVMSNFFISLSIGVGTLIAGFSIVLSFMWSLSKDIQKTEKTLTDEIKKTRYKGK